MYFKPLEYDSLRGYLGDRGDRLKELDALFKAGDFDDEAERKWAEICKKATENLEEDTAKVIKAVIGAREEPDPDSISTLDDAKYLLFESEGRKWLAEQALAWRILSSRGAEFARTFLAVQELNEAIDAAVASYVAKMTVFHEEAFKTAANITEVISFVEAALTGGWFDYLRMKHFPGESKWAAARNSMMLIISDRYGAWLLESLIKQICEATTTYFAESSRDGALHVRGLEKLRETPGELENLKPFNGHWKGWKEKSKKAQEVFNRSMKKYKEITESSRKGLLLENAKLKGLKLIGGGGVHLGRDFQKVQRDMEKWLEAQD
ncbi:MAG: hypothetical protein ACI8RZ_007330 [Myxococcota bacterium]|jgi:hypothetical protein